MVDVAQLVEPRIVIPAVAGSSPVVHPNSVGRVRVRQFVCMGLFGPLAQLVEQLTLNQLVVGSIPTRPTNSINSLDAREGHSKSGSDQRVTNSLSMRRWKLRKRSLDGIRGRDLVHSHGY
jgi:hypothetical protein